ncbi:hypothetical protein M422DRAFT_53756 [Sphaerobolus stellatus SS14]|uniref:Uncharacterized protein n=1 Tax=Sphaerobolus stellatus (strain SS14) TaxID=990650 RepID=A0A0C9UYG7_SPHS4|nr:hypothetical protein M422DRAFT_53756 [Sphaerobolus stellatus SS14]
MTLIGTTGQCISVAGPSSGNITNITRVTPGAGPEAFAKGTGTNNQEGYTILPVLQKHSLAIANTAPPSFDMATLTGLNLQEMINAAILTQPLVQVQQPIQQPASMQQPGMSNRSEVMGTNPGMHAAGTFDQMTNDMQLHTALLTNHTGFDPRMGLEAEFAMDQFGTGNDFLTPPGGGGW